MKRKRYMSSKNLYNQSLGGRKADEQLE